jgi:glutamine amidotransferase
MAFAEGADMSGRRIAVIDYKAGNLTSVLKGLAAAGAEPFVTEDAHDVATAGAIVVPGVGHFAATRAIDGPMRAALTSAIERGRPVLGVCLGLQFLFEGSEEAPDLQGLRVLAGRCTLLRGDMKVPHVGWNTIARRRDSPLLAGVRDGAYVYFTHSYAAPADDGCVAATTYGTPFAAVVERGRVFGVQFHPEKSGEDGLRILRNFVALC